MMKRLKRQNTNYASMFFTGLTGAAALLGFCSSSWAMS
jgi:hypothetical protein